MSNIRAVTKGNGLTAEQNNSSYKITTKFKATWFIFCDVAYASNGKSAIHIGYNGSVVAFFGANSSQTNLVCNMVPTSYVTWVNNYVAVMGNTMFGWLNAFALYG